MPRLSFDVDMTDPYKGVESESEVDGTRTLDDRKFRRCQLYFMRCDADVYDPNLRGPLAYVLAVAFHTVCKFPNVPALVAIIGRMVLTLIPHGKFLERKGLFAVLKAALPTPWKPWTADVVETVAGAACLPHGLTHALPHGLTHALPHGLTLDMARVIKLIMVWQQDPTLEVVFPSLNLVAETFGSNRKLNCAKRKRFLC